MLSKELEKRMSRLSKDDWTLEKMGRDYFFTIWRHDLEAELELRAKSPSALAKKIIKAIDGMSKGK